MAEFSGDTKTIDQLPSGTPTDFDYFIFGKGALKKITFFELIGKLFPVSKSTIEYESGITPYQSEIKRVGGICIVSMCFEISSGLSGFSDVPICTVGKNSYQYVNMPLFNQSDGRCVDCFIKSGENKIYANARGNNIESAGVLRGALVFPIKQ